jgi:hypothetical protein
MQAILYVLAGLIGLVGLMFVIGAQGQPLRIVVGVVLMLGAAALAYVARMRPRAMTIVQQIDLPSDTALEQMKCHECGGSLGRESVEVSAGAVFVNCQFCGAAYQLEEQPKW